MHAADLDLEQLYQVVEVGSNLRFYEARRRIAEAAPPRWGFDARGCHCHASIQCVHRVLYGWPDAFSPVSGGAPPGIRSTARAGNVKLGDSCLLLASQH